MNGGGLSEVERRTLEILSAPAVLLMILWLLTSAAWAAIGFDLVLGLAGFAATRLLVPSGASGGSPGRLWSAALRWIGPSLLVVGIASLGFGLLCLPPGDLKRQALVMLTAPAGLWGLLPGADMPARSDDLWLHVWIVGVAAQLALGWSLVVAGAQALGKRGLIRPLAAVGLMAALALDLWLAATGRERQALLLAPAQAAPFLAGALVAMSPLRSPAAWIAFLRGPAGAGLAGVGRLAVPFWLWLWPLWQGVRLIAARSPTPLEVMAVLAAAVGLALATAVLTTALGSGRRRVHTGVVLAVLALVAGSLVALDGLPGRAAPAVRAEEAAARRTPPLQAACNVESDRLPPAHACTVPAGSGPDVVLWGNSHASHLSPALLAWAEGRGLGVRQATRSGCLPLLRPRAGLVDQGCLAFNRAAVAEWGRASPEVILLGAGWTVVLEQAPGDPGRNLDALIEETAHTVRALRAAVGPGTLIVLLGTTPDHDFAPGACHARRAFLGLDTMRCDLAIPANAGLARAVDARLAALAAAEPGVALYRPWTALCQGMAEDDRCRTRGGGDPWYSDMNHLTAAGGARQAEALAAVLDSRFPRGP